MRVPIFEDHPINMQTYIRIGEREFVFHLPFAQIEIPFMLEFLPLELFL